MSNNEPNAFQTILGLDTALSVTSDMFLPTAQSSGTDVKISMPDVKISIPQLKSFILENNTTLFVGIDEISGVNDADHGSLQLPYASLQYAQSQVTGQSPTNRYVFFITSDLNPPVDAQIYAMPNTSFYSPVNANINNTLPIIPSTDWDSAASGSVFICENVYLQNGCNFDFSVRTPTAPECNFINSTLSGTASIFNGYASGDSPLTKFYFENSKITFASVDNCIFKSGGQNYFDGGLFFGRGTTTTGLIINLSYGDVFDGGINYYINNTVSTNVCSISAYGIKNIGNFDIASDVFTSATNLKCVVLGSEITGGINIGTNSAGYFDLEFSSMKKPVSISLSGDGSVTTTLKIDLASMPYSIDGSSLATNNSQLIILDNNVYDWTFGAASFIISTGVTYLVSSDFTPSLPLYSKKGDNITIIRDNNTNAMTISQAAGQKIVSGKSSTTVGVTGHLDFLNASGATKLVLTALTDDSTVWLADASQPVDYN